MNDKLIMKQISEGTNLEVVLPEFTTNLATYYHEYAMVRLAMEYVMLYEQVEEEKSDLGSESIEEFNQLLTVYLSNQVNGEERENFLNRISKLRRNIMKRMEVLTAYTDRFQTFEYILNRKEKCFEEIEEEEDLEFFISKVVNYIFSVNDNFVVNERMKEILSQLPVRMTKAKFFETIQNTLSIYKGADIASLDSHLYMLRSSTLVYKPEGMEDYYEELAKSSQQFFHTDFKSLTNEDFSELVRQLENCGNIIRSNVDFFMSFEEAVNSLYVLILTNPYAWLEDSEVKDASLSILRTTNEAFIKQDKQPLSETVFEKMSMLEGIQEKIFESYEKLELNLDKIGDNYSKLIESLLLSPVFNCLTASSKLLSPSLFIDLDQEEKKGQVSEEYLIKVTENLLAEYEELWKSLPQQMKRAIISNSFRSLPLMFQTSDEFIDYMKNSLESCNDLAEKTACMELIDYIINDEM